MATVFVTLYPRVMVSSLGEANDLTIENTAAASYSLTVMTWVAAILLPVVLGYQWWTYHVFRQRLGPAATAGPGVHIPTQRGPGRRAAEQDDGRSAPAVAPHRPPPAPRS
ncbi:cytochrome d ubiquinol oxidase subunit II [Geodermatophilus sp. SYSU D00803]